MLLTSALDPRVAGKYAAAGTTAIDRLLTADEAFVITTTGARVAVREAEGELDYVERAGNNQRVVSTIKFRRGKHSFSGLHVKDGGTFIFQDSELMWQQATIVRFQLRASIGGTEETFSSVADFARRYTTLVTLD
jgi:hypothetical protein